MLTTSSRIAVVGLSIALRKVGLIEIADGLKAANSVADDQKGVAADLCATLATVYASKHPEVSRAALKTYFVLSDEAGITQKVCSSCVFSLHIQGVHKHDNETDICGCYCQRN